MIDEKMADILHKALLRSGKVIKPELKALTVTEIRDALEQEFCDSGVKRNWADDLRVARAIEAKLLEKNT
jgi:hypothetical protein